MPDVLLITFNPLNCGRVLVELTVVDSLWLWLEQTLPGALAPLLESSLEYVLALAVTVWSVFAFPPVEPTAVVDVPTKNLSE